MYGGFKVSKKIKLSSDSTTDLGKELQEKYNVSILPMGVTLGGNLYYDGVDITPEMIYEHHDKTGELPKTNANNVEECIEFFKELTKDGSAVIHFTISSDMSSTFNNARLAAEEFEDVYVVDTRNLSTGGGLLVLAAADMINEGLEAKDIAEKLKEIAPNVDASFVIDSLEYLYKGGRCSALSVFGANLLKLKPCIAVKNGVMDVDKKYRGKYEVVLEEYIKDRLHDPDNIVPTRAFITHAGCDEAVVKKMIELVKSTGIFDEVFETRASSTVSSHCGKDTLGVLFIRKTPI
ncbi:MAG: DegV family protein [Clostridia bacterium]|nr:DegV family protein [Clostridia bacterium]MBR3145216.1 DegV family protein [Clostridia bacterium]